MKKSKTHANVDRGLAWLKVFGREYQLDVGRVDLDTLDMGTKDQDILSQSYAGFTTRWRDPFNQVCDRLSSKLESERELERFLCTHGFDLPDLNWFQARILRMDGASGWPELTEAWREALRRDRGEVQS